MMESRWVRFDTDTWSRKDAFEFFKSYDDPFFNICTTVDLTRFLEHVKTHQKPFSLSLLHCVLQVVNTIPEFRLRLDEHGVISYDVIHCGATILHDDKRFSFCYLTYFDNPEIFCRESELTIARHKEQSGLQDHSVANNKVHVSILPWTHFSAVKHPRNRNKWDAIPVFTLGKYKKNNDKTELPISVEVHHALMDGYHVALFFEEFQKTLDHF